MGSRLFDKSDPNRRTLSCYDDSDRDDPLAHGLIVGSYREGISPDSFYFHCVAGREGKLFFVYSI